MLLILIIKLFLVLVYLINENLSVDIYISLNGKDTVGCGNKTTMCQSLQFVLQHTKHVDIIIHLDGGSLKPFVYIQNKTMVYDGKIVIKKMNGSLYKPTIKKDEKVGFKSFIIEFPSIPNLEIESIIFNEIKLVRFNKIEPKSSKGEINITNCICDVSRFSIMGGEYLIDSGPSGFISIKINNLKIKAGVEYLIDSTPIDKLNLSIRNSFLTDSSIFFNSSKGSLNINNSIVTSSFDNPLTIFVVEGEEVNIENTDFSISPLAGIIINSVKKIIISQCHFGDVFGKNEEVYLQLSSIETVVITSCFFMNMAPNTIFNMLLNNIVTLTIDDCHFKQLDISSIDVYNCTNVLLQNNVFNELRSTSMGFFLLLSNTIYIKVINTTFTKCSSPISVSNVHFLSIEKSYFMKNGYIDFCFNSQSKSAISCDHSNIDILASTFTKNCAIKGAALNSINCTLEILTSSFIENYADSAGTFYFDSNTKASLSNVSIVSPVDNIPLFTTIIESANITTFENVNITILNTTDSIDMLMFSARIKGRLNYSCPLERKVSITGTKIWKCTSCEKGKYSLKSGFIYYENSTYISSQDIDCKDCPLGGTCNHEIFSRGNFWGYVIKNEVMFIPCLKYYCCDNLNTICSSIATCYSNREGRLCGKCLTHHYIDFFTNECFPNDTCNRSTEFWCIFIIIVIAFFILIAYLKDFLTLVKAKLRHVRKQEHEDQLDENLVEPLIQEDENTDRFEFKYAKENRSKIDQGILKILINFYQVNMLINVPMHISSTTSNNIISDVVQTLFTLKLTVKKLSLSFCPMKNLNAITKLFIKDIVFILLVLLLIASLSTVFYIIQLFKKWKRNRLNSCNDNIDYSQGSNNPNHGMIETVETNNEEISISLTFYVRCKVCLIQVLLIGYTNIATFTLQMLNCVKINEDYYLYISAEELCFAAWQYGVIIFLLCWVVPFSLTLYFSTLLLRNKRITINEFILCLIFPPTLVYLYLKTKYGNSIIVLSSKSESTPILSVLQDSFCKDGKTQILWDPVILARRIVIVAFVTFLINPIPRLCCVFFILVLYLFHHSQVLPYRMPLLNNLESFCLLNLCFLTCVNLFRAFVYVYSLPVDQLPMNVINKVFNIYEFILITSPITISVFYILWLISTKVVGKLHQLCIKKNN